MCKSGLVAISDTYFFTDITEEFLLDFAFWLKERGIRNGNKAGLTHKLRLLRAVCRLAEKKEKDNGLWKGITYDDENDKPNS